MIFKYKKSVIKFRVTMHYMGEWPYIVEYKAEGSEEIGPYDVRNRLCWCIWGNVVAAVRIRKENYDKWNSRQDHNGSH
jgi:hypothetical protein